MTKKVYSSDKTEFAEIDIVAQCAYVSASGFKEKDGKLMAFPAELDISRTIKARRYDISATFGDFRLVHISDIPDDLLRITLLGVETAVFDYLNQVSSGEDLPENRLRAMNYDWNLE
jgi:hypothetical protein